MGVIREAAEKLVALVLLLLLAPIIVIVAILIRVDSEGPVIFQQERIGLKGRPFLMSKFRTMYVDTEKQHGELMRMQVKNGGSFLLHASADPRVTRVGRVLRRTSLDEIPQFFNVLNGTMSLVGPRPMLDSEVKLLSVEQMRRFNVMPGITGLAQVKGRSLLGADKYVELDLRFIDEFGPMMYAQVLLSTPLAILSGRGAV